MDKVGGEVATAIVYLANVIFAQGINYIRLMSSDTTSMTFYKNAMLGSCILGFLVILGFMTFSLVVLLYRGRTEMTFRFAALPALTVRPASHYLLSAPLPSYPGTQLGHHDGLLYQHRLVHAAGGSRASGLHNPGAVARYQQVRPNAS